MRTDQNSRRMYVAIDPSNIAMFRFLLEGYGHLALFTMVSRGVAGRPAVLKLRHAPDFGHALEQALQDMSAILSFTILPAPLQPLPALAEKTP